jgi:hypothetical protein
VRRLAAALVVFGRIPIDGEFMTHNFPMFAAGEAEL